VDQFWYKYVFLEELLENIAGARRIFERWMACNGCNQHARAVALLPHVVQLWYKYVYLEERLENIAGARQIFERWMVCNGGNHCRSPINSRRAAPNYNALQVPAAITLTLPLKPVATVITATNINSPTLHAGMDVIVIVHNGHAQRV
jgi:hypothetical protein